MVTCLLNKQVRYFVFTFLKSEKKIKSLAMSYSHMGKPHTTIGANSFHFWVRNGNQVGPNRYGRQANSLIRKAVSVLTHSILFLLWVHQNPLGVVWLSLTGN